MDELPPELKQYEKEDALARKMIREGRAPINNGWDSDLENNPPRTFGQTGFGDAFSRENRNFGRGNRRFRSNHHNNSTRTRTNPNWRRNPPYLTKFNPEFQVHTNESFVRDFQCEGNWVTKICSRSSDVDSFQLEVESLYEDMKATEEEIIKKELFRKTIENMLNKFDRELDLKWNCQVFQTGSSISGLAAKGSDVDLCIFIPNASKIGFSERVNSFRILQFVRHFLMMQKDKGPTEAFPFDLDEITLRDAMIPIIKIYTECGLECDLSACCDPFLSGVHNSLLIKGYTEFDPRFAPLAMFVKAWASKTKLKQPIRPKAKFNSYAITMLLIHFLQCGVDPPVLPNLRKKCGPEFYATSETDFPVKLDVRQMPKPTIDPDTIPNLMSLAELFIRFCLYYSNFDYFNWYLSLKESKVCLRANRTDIRRFVRCYIEDPIDQHNPGRTLHDLPGARFIFRNTANAFRHAVYHPDHFPSVQQILVNEMFENGRYLLIKKTKNPPRFKVIKGEVVLPEVPKEENSLPTVSAEELRPDPEAVPESTEEEAAIPGVVIPEDYEFDDESASDEEYEGVQNDEDEENEA